MGDARIVNNHAHEELLASSPTINGLNSPQNWTPQMAERRSSVASSLRSEDFENWPGFDSHDKFDDSGLGMEEQETRDHFPGDANTREEMETERWLSRHSSGSDESDDPYSSAALSRRAEIILANAKKRLNVGATVSRETIGRLLTTTGHGRKPPRRPRIARRLSHLQLQEKPVRSLVTHQYRPRSRPQTVRRTRPYTPAGALLSILSSFSDQPKPRARFERDLRAIALLFAHIHDPNHGEQASVERNRPYIRSMVIGRDWPRAPVRPRSLPNQRVAQRRGPA
jgi:hypothetical protein